MSGQVPLIILFDVTYFRAAYPEFGSLQAFPDAKLQMYWDWSTHYISNVNFGWLCGYARVQALNLMLCHLLQLMLEAAAGELPGIVNNAVVDKVTVGIVPPPFPNQWQYWLQTTGYGRQLLALLQVKSAGGFYIGGPPVLAAFPSQNTRFL